MAKNTHEKDEEKVTPHTAAQKKLESYELLFIIGFGVLFGIRAGYERGLKDGREAAE